MGLLMQDSAGGQVSRIKHFLVLSWPGFGHITCLLEYSRQLIAAGHQVTFAVSESLVEGMRTRKMISPADENAIRFLGLKDGVQHNTFDENMSSETMLEATGKMCDAAKEFILQLPSTGQLDLQPIDIIVTDMTNGDIPILAGREMNIPVVVFSTTAGFMTLQLLKVNDDTPLSDCSDIRKEMNLEAWPKGWKDHLVKTSKAIVQADALVINSFAALEKDFHTELMKQCPDVAAENVSFVGPITKGLSEGSAWKNNPEVMRVSNWLDEQAERSVVYFSFGSVAAVNERQVQEIEQALTGMDRPFIWALRPQQQRLLSKKVQEAIEVQFDRPNAPYLILSWAPQMTILKHNATRVFVSHCGWNSTLEGICSGVPMVGWPMFGDQHGDADLITNTGCGKRILNTDMSGERVVDKQELTGAIEEVAQWDTPLSQNSFFLTAQQLSKDATGTLAMNDSFKETLPSF